MMSASFSASASKPHSALQELLPSNGEAKTALAAAPAILPTAMYSAKPWMEVVAEAEIPSSVDG